MGKLQNIKKSVIKTLIRTVLYLRLSDEDRNKLTKEQIISLEELLKLEPGIYSTELFINNNPLLMKELDIKDEYELHYILRNFVLTSLS